jgi:sugar lactone lactonase YvrE
MTPMGMQSSTHPMRTKHSPARPTLPESALRRFFCAVAVTLAAVCWPAVGLAQSQSTATSLILPSALVFDANGNLYFAETGNHVIRKFAPDGTITVIAGTGVQGFSGDGGPATAAMLDSPQGLALDAAGTLYIADTHNHRVRRVDAATGAIATIAGNGVAAFSGDGGAATGAALDLPTALALDATASNLYFADTANHRIRRVAFATGLIATAAGDGTQGFSGDNGPAIAASIDSPLGLAVDSGGNLYLADSHNQRIRRVDGSSGLITTVAGTGALGSGGDSGQAAVATLALPRGVTLDANGNLYLADTANQRIRRISSAGVITTIAGDGVEAFLGDGAPAIAAALDSPRGVTLSPGGLVTLSDTGNQRIRQVDALPSPGPDIHTLAGIGLIQQGVLTLSAPFVMPYGSGTLTATLAANTLATGSVTFLDTTSASTMTLGTASLSSDTAAFTLATESAGTHSFTAVYPGDVTHAAAQSAALSVTIAPLSVTATPNAISVLYGQTIPALTGILTGVLTQDTQNVSAVFTTTAVALSPADTYPIAATLTGTAAGDYSLNIAPETVTISRAPTLTTEFPSATTISVGSSVTLSVQTTSTTSGTPTGSVTLSDGGVALTTLPLTGSGTATFTTSALATGTHAIAASYSGDANFLPSTSIAASIAVGPGSDFTLALSSPSTQSVPSGSAATYAFSVQYQGTPLTSSINLAVQGVPTGSTVSLNPANLPPGGSVTAFTLTITTPKVARLESPHPSASRSIYLGFALLPALGFLPRRRRLRRTLAVFALAGIFAAMLGCGDRINTVPELANSATYTITVSGTATSPTGTQLQHSVNVTLQVL